MGSANTKYADDGHDFVAIAQNAVSALSPMHRGPITSWGTGERGQLINARGDRRGIATGNPSSSGPWIEAVERTVALVL